jgi:small-conductance mechanosensitive channel
MTEFINRWINEPVIIKLIVGLVGVIIILGLFRLLLKATTRSIENLAVRYRIRKVISFLGFLFALLFLAGEFSDQIHSITVALGVASAGIAFALQEVIVSVAGWIAISFGHFYKVGDRVQLSGTSGDVIDIGVLSTTLMEIGEWVKTDLYSGRIVRVANSVVFTETVYNFSGDFPFLWDEIVVPIKYGSDTRLARSILYKAAQEVVSEYHEPAKAKWKEMCQKYHLEHESVEPMVTLAANDNWIEFTLRYIVEYKKRRAVKDELFESILGEIEKSEDKVAIASTTLQLVDLPVVKLDISDRKV